MALPPFLAALFGAIEAGIESAPDARPMVDAVARHLALHEPAFSVQQPGLLPVCGQLGQALQAAHGHVPEIARLADGFAALAPLLAWKPRAHAAEQSDAFLHGHANALILGHGDFTQPEAVTLGVTVMAPGVTYPDHAHPPEELYVVLSPGRWRQNHGAWSARDAGGLLHNPAGINHGMQSGDGPLLALWLLWRGEMVPRTGFEPV